MRTISLSLACVGLLAAPMARAADHGDGTSSGIALALEPAADINDVFAWMSADATRVNLGMSVFPGAAAGSQFSDAVKYVLHTASSAIYLGTPTRRDIVCTFSNATPQVASCWLSDPVTGSVKGFVTGNAGTTAGLATPDGGVKVFAGPRSDPFFFNLAGFRNATAAVAAAIKEAGPTLQGTFIKGVDTTHPGCPVLTIAARTAVGTYLNHDCSGTGAPVNFFEKPAGTENAACTVKPALVATQAMNTGLTGNILAIVLTVDKALLTVGGPVLSVWAATTK
jgi:hypothetical protein